MLPFKAIGGRDPTPPLQSPQEQMMRGHIVDSLKENNMEMKTVVRIFNPEWNNIFAFSSDELPLLALCKIILLSALIQV